MPCADLGDISPQCSQTPLPVILADRHPAASRTRPRGGLAARPLESVLILTQIWRFLLCAASGMTAEPLGLVVLESAVIFLHSLARGVPTGKTPVALILHQESKS